MISSLSYILFSWRKWLLLFGFVCVVFWFGFLAVLEPRASCMLCVLQWSLLARHLVVGLLLITTCCFCNPTWLCLIVDKPVLCSTLSPDPGFTSPIGILQDRFSGWLAFLALARENEKSVPTIEYYFKVIIMFSFWKIWMLMELTVENNFIGISGPQFMCIFQEV